MDIYEGNRKEGARMLLELSNDIWLVGSGRVLKPKPDAASMDVVEEPKGTWILDNIVVEVGLVPRQELSQLSADVGSTRATLRFAEAKAQVGLLHKSTGRTLPLIAYHYRSCYGQMCPKALFWLGL